jgi:hypothetical protein
MVNNKHSQNGAQRKGKSGSHEEVADTLSSISQGNVIDYERQEGCIHTGKGDSLKYSHEKKGPERTEYDGSEEGNPEYDGAGYHNTFF